MYYNRKLAINNDNNNSNDKHLLRTRNYKRHTLESNPIIKIIKNVILFSSKSQR